MSVPLVPPICLMCKRFKGGLGNPVGKPTCQAFPDGIPDEILYRAYDHREPYLDEEILFEKRAEVSDAQVEEWEKMALEFMKEGMLTAIDALENPTPEE
ncbi:MAG TPA: hypothetical protein VF377_08930 [Acidimicrobiia bacterium]